MVKHSSVTGVLELFGELTTDLDLDHVRLAFLLFANKMTVLTVDFEMAFWSAARIKPNNIIAFFPRFYSTTRFKKNSLPDS